MEIKIDHSLMEMFGTPPSRKLEDVNEIVIHHTDGGGTNKSLFQWFKSKDCPNHELYKKFVALTHYYIQKDGEIVEAYPLDTWLFHSCSGQRDSKTIGIELIHKTGEFRPEQYESLFWLIFDHIPSVCPNIKVISSHDYRYNLYSKKTKNCPSQWFDWAKLKGANTKGFKVHYI